MNEPVELTEEQAEVWRQRMAGQQVRQDGEHRSFFGCAQPGGVIEVDADMSPEAFERLKERHREAYTGSQNAHKVAPFTDCPFCDCPAPDEPTGDCDCECHDDNPS